MKALFKDTYKYVTIKTALKKWKEFYLFFYSYCRMWIFQKSLICNVIIHIKNALFKFLLKNCMRIYLDENFGIAITNIYRGCFTLTSSDKYFEKYERTFCTKVL